MKLNKKSILLGVITVILIWLLSAVIISYSYDSSDRGTFGDMFGAINALFSGLALFGIIVSILIQQNELNLQRLELSDTRKEFKVNRITNILFKQVEYTNSLIDEESFKIPFFDGDTRDLDLDSFIKVIESGKDFKNIMNENSEIVSSLINQLILIIDDFEYLLEFNNLNENEKYQMSFLFRSNIKPNLYGFLHFQIEFLKESLEVDIEKNKNALLLNDLIKLQLRSINRILMFGKR